MNSSPTTIDPVWEERYAAGAQQRYPWSQVVSFVMRNRPRDRAIADTRILEIGCGTGGNLWFAAREGFQITGRDGSASAIEAAQKRFSEDGLAGSFDVGEFVPLPYDDGTFDLVIDRGALTCVRFQTICEAISEVRRVLAPSGRMLFTPYGDTHSSIASATLLGDHYYGDISAGTVQGFGSLAFLGIDQIREAFADGWKIREAVLVEERDFATEGQLHAEWKVVAEAQPEPG